MITAIAVMITVIRYDPILSVRDNGEKLYISLCGWHLSTVFLLCLINTYRKYTIVTARQRELPHSK